MHILTLIIIAQYIYNCTDRNLKITLNYYDRNSPKYGGSNSLVHNDLFCLSTLTLSFDVFSDVATNIKLPD